MTEKPPALYSDPFGTKEALGLAFKKLSSQALVFSLAMVVVVLTASALDAPPGIICVILGIFLVGLLSYLFVEQKNKIAREDPETMSELVGKQLGAIENAAASSPLAAQAEAAEFSVQLAVTEVSETGAQSRDISVRRSEKKNEYHIGDTIVLQFEATRDCYLTLLNIGTSGKLTILFPNALYRENLIKAGTRYQIPGADYGFDYVLQGPAGVEKLKAIATLDKTELVETQFAADGSFFVTHSPSAAARDIATVKRKVSALPKDRWTEASCDFRVVA
jgi:hypothetical protein